MLRSLKTVLLLTFLFSTQVFAQGAVFLLIYPGARAVGMGGGFTAVADNASATYYNPAGLGFQKEVDIYLCHTRWLPGLWSGMRYIFGSAVAPLKWATPGFSCVYLTTGETDVIDENGNFLGRYRTYDMAPAVSIGKMVLPFLAVGGSLKYIYSFLVPEWVWEVMPELGIETGGTAKSVALDLSTLFSFFTFGKTGFGLVTQNIGPGPGIKYTSTGTKDPLPTAIELGLSHKITSKDITEKESDNWLTNSSHLIFACDLYRSLVTRNVIWYSFGTELQIAPFAIRTGRFIDSKGGRVGRTVGLGLDLKYLKLNLANDANIYQFFFTENLRYDLTVGFPFNY